MESRLAGELKLSSQPVAIILTDEKPHQALQFQPGRWGCVMAMLRAASKGKTAVFDRETVGCGGGGVGLGFGNTFHTGGAGDTGGIEYFLSTGRGEGYREGEGYRRTPELARGFVDHLPIVDLPWKYRVFKPLDQVDPAREEPCLVTFYVGADQLCGLVVMANYDRPDLYYTGVPALVVEIVSESTRGKDLIKKLDLYMATGVREYWIVNPLNREVSVYLFEDNDIRKTATYKNQETAASFHFGGLAAGLDAIFA